MKKHFKWLPVLVAGMLSAGSLSAADYNIVTYGAKEGGARCSIPTPYSG